MATLSEWISCYLEYLSELFFRFIWPVKYTIDGIENKAVLVTGELILVQVNQFALLFTGLSC